MFANSAIVPHAAGNWSFPVLRARVFSPLVCALRNVAQANSNGTANVDNLPNRTNLGRTCDTSRIMTCLDAPSQVPDDGEKNAVSSKRRNLIFVPAIPMRKALRKMRVLEQKRAILRHGVLSKKAPVFQQKREGFFRSEGVSQDNVQSHIEEIVKLLG